MSKGPSAGRNDEDRAWLRDKVKHAIRRIERNPYETLAQYNADAKTGLNCDEINRSAREIGLIGPDEYIIKRRVTTEDERKVETVVVRHPDPRRPQLEIQVVGPSKPSPREVVALADEIEQYLEAWADRSVRGETGHEPDERPTGASDSAAAPSAQPAPLSAKPCPVALHMLPSMVADFAGRLWYVIPVARKLQTNMQQLEAAERAGQLTEVVRRGEFPYEGRLLSQDEATRLQEDAQCDAAIRAVMSARHLHNAIPELLARLDRDSVWIDAEFPGKKKGTRWSDRARADLRDLHAALYRGQDADGVGSSLPRPDQGVAACVEAVTDRLEQRIRDLGTIRRSRAKPKEIDAALTPQVCEKLHPIEATALMQLGERRYWGLDELPEYISMDVLRRLDNLGLVEVCLPGVSQAMVVEGEFRPARAERGHWHSPMKWPGKPRTWEDIFTRRNKLDERNLPAEVAVSEPGRAEITRLQLAIGLPLKPLNDGEDGESEQGGTEKGVHRPEPAPKRQEPKTLTRSASLNEAAGWFGFKDYRTLKDCIENGTKWAFKVSDQRWVFDLDQVLPKKRRMADPATPTPRSKRKRRSRKS